MNEDKSIAKERLERELAIFKEINNEFKWFYIYINNNLDTKYKKLRFTPDITNRIEKDILTKEIVIGYDKEGNEEKIYLKDMTFPNGRYTIRTVINKLEYLIKRGKGSEKTKLIYEELKNMLCVYVLNLENSNEKFQKIMGVYQNPVIARKVYDLTEAIDIFCLTEAGRIVVNIAKRKNIIDKNLKAKEGRLGDWLLLIYRKSIESEIIYSQILESLNEKTNSKR